MQATGSTSQDSDACVIHGNRVFGNMGLQSGVMVSSRRISRACSKVKYQGKRRTGQALRPITIYHGGKLRRGGVRQYVQGQGVPHLFVRISQGCLAGRYVRNLFARGRDQSGTHDCRGVCALGVARAQADALQLSWGLASAKRRRHSAHEGQARFLVLGEFCQVASEG